MNLTYHTRTVIALTSYFRQIYGKVSKNASGCICYFITIGVAYFHKSHKASYNCAFIFCDFFPHNDNTLLVDSSDITG